MSRNHDLLFCKIAITNGLISQDVAQKALQLCDKRELETGRRPLIGAIFTKHNLIGKPDVQRLYTAVEKRLGTPAGPQLAAPPRGRGAKGRARAERRGKPTRPVDPKTLWMGIGGLVVFIGILGAILAMILTPSGSEEESPVPPGGGQVAGAASGGARSSSPGAAGKAAAGGSASPVSPISSGPKEIPADIMTQISEGMGAIIDWRTDPERVAEGLNRLETWAQQLRGKGYEPPEILTSRIAEFRQSMKDLGVAEGAGDAVPPSAESPTAEPPTMGTVETPAAEPTTPAAEPETPSAVDDLESELFGES